MNTHYTFYITSLVRQFEKVRSIERSGPLKLWSTVLTILRLPKKFFFKHRPFFMPCIMNSYWEQSRVSRLLSIAIHNARHEKWAVLEKNFFGNGTRHTVIRLPITLPYCDARHCFYHLLSNQKPIYPLKVDVSKIVYVTSVAGGTDSWSEK